MTKLSPLLLATLALLGIYRPANAEASPQGISFATKRLAEIPKKFNADSAYAYFGPFGRRFAYQAHVGGLGYMVVDGEESKGHQFNDGLTFSPDGKRYAHRSGDRLPGNRSEKWRMIVDGKPQKARSWIGSPVFSADGEKVIYWGATGVKIARTGEYRGGKYYLQFDDKQTSKAYRDARGLLQPVISPDGKHVGTVAMKGGSWFVLIDRKSFGPFSMAGFPTFAPKGSGVAWPAMGRKGRAEIMLGKKKTVKGNYDAVGLPRFTPDGKKLGFAASRNQKMFVVFGKKTLPGDYTALGPPCFDGKGKRIAFAGRVGGTPTMMGPVIDDYSLLEISAPPGMGGQPPLQPGRWSLVVDGKPLPAQYDQVADPVFSPDGKAIAYRARTGKQWFVVLGATKSAACQQVGKTVFSADGKKLAFGCRRGRELWWQVLDVK